MATDGDTHIVAHYESGELARRLETVLREDGVDPARPTVAALAPYDQFHGRGLEATEEVAAALSLLASDDVLDIGSGIGGPARFIADRYGCHVTGIDLTPEFCQLARELTARVGLDDRVCFEEGSALAMPFADASFDAAYSINVAMNIADKAGFYAEIARVLKPGARLVLSEIARGQGPEVDYPTPWASSAAASFLATPEETRAGLEAAGFVIVNLADKVAESADYGARSRQAVEQGGKPMHRAVGLVHGDRAAAAMANSALAVREGRTIPIEILCRKRS
jgi:ubiquinone/menaquinone biosynthesis C-methylase UbiE